ncbi:MAG: SurA N-terminal domain-containing protein [Bacteroidales bacterium]|jgi:peptidyl-prolyl cis-trans isomerase D|nr:SurA N-terminal domain-containing protein [Bacteroidales bacterium]MBQ6301054.1 SurA N-terminal domain-containing protein [Bacteroidales bacterium]
MAILQKTRDKAGLAVSIIIALALLSFIIDPGTLESAFNMMSSKNNVGEINGKAVSYTDFQQDVDRFTVVNEMVTGNSAQSDQQQQQIRNAAWQSLVDKYLFTKKAADAGIKVGEEELKELLAGDMVSPVISQNPVFQDENGNFSKTALQNIINAVQTDQTGRLKTYWDYIQNTVFTQQFYAKYGSLFSASNFQNPLMLKRAIADNNNTANVDFVLVPSVFTQDSTITVSDEEVQKYYNDHKSLYRQNASRDMEYVVFEVTPSAADIEATKEAMNSIYDEFSTTEAVKTFLARNSEKPLSEYWYRAGELNTINTDLNEFVFSNASGTSPIVSDNENVFYAGRIMATAQVPDSIYVRHILFAATDSQEKIDSVMNVLQKGESFANVATSVSADTQSAADGGQGNIGWLTQSYMIPGFEPALTAQVGKPFVLKTQYGTHIVEVTKRTAPVTKKQVAILQKSSLSSNETFNDYYSQASKFAKLAAGDYKNYKAAVDTLGVYSHPMTAVQESNDTYGSINQAREVTRWIFDNKVGKVSDIITVNNNYFFIATVTGIHKDGIATLDETKDVIRQQLFAQKAAEKAAADVAEQIKGMDDLQEIADKLNTSVSSDVDVRFASLNGQGLDPKFIGAVSVAPEGKICGPVAGMIGTYVFKVNGRDTGAFYTEDDAKANADQMASYMSQMILPVMMLDADVKDNRARFF